LKFGVEDSVSKFGLPLETERDNDDNRFSVGGA
jgi:hypothetical protein